MCMVFAQVPQDKQTSDTTAVETLDKTSEEPACEYIKYKYFVTVLLPLMDVSLWRFGVNPCEHWGCLVHNFTKAKNVFTTKM